MKRQTGNRVLGIGLILMVLSFLVAVMNSVQQGIIVFVIGLILVIVGITFKKPKTMKEKAKVKVETKGKIKELE